MKILFDLPRLQEKSLGMQSYFKNSISAMLGQSPANWQFSVHTVGLRGLATHKKVLQSWSPEKPLCLIWEPLPATWQESLIQNFNWSMQRSSLNKFDLIHSLGCQMLPRLKAPLVVTIQDLIPIVLKESGEAVCERALRILDNLCRQAELITTVSTFSANDIERVLNVDRKKIRVVPAGVNLERFKPLQDTEVSSWKETLTKYNINSPYIFHSGGSVDRKNTASLVRAFDLACSLEGDFRSDLVLVGALSQNSQLEQAIAASTNKGRIRYLGYLDSNEAIILLKGAQALVFPSTYEGFGLPPLEAMACAVPTALSQAASLPEVGGDACLYFDPLDEESQAQAILKLSLDETMREELAKKGLERAQGFSWSNNAKQMLDIYQSLVS